jgi:hypothetical protein
MDRTELVRWVVLDEISDGYQNADQLILPSVAKIGVKLGFTIARSEIVDALAGLVADGLAKAYLLSSTVPYRTELPGMPPLDFIEEYFDSERRRQAGRIARPTQSEEMVQPGGPVRLK